MWRFNEKPSIFTLVALLCGITDIVTAHYQSRLFPLSPINIVCAGKSVRTNCFILCSSFALAQVTQKSTTNKGTLSNSHNVMSQSYRPAPECPWLEAALVLLQHTVSKQYFYSFISFFFLIDRVSNGSQLWIGPPAEWSAERDATEAVKLIHYAVANAGETCSRFHPKSFANRMKMAWPTPLIQIWIEHRICIKSKHRFRSSVERLSWSRGQSGPDRLLTSV